MAEKKKQQMTAMPVFETAEEKQKAIETTMQKIEKDFGKGAVMMLGANTKMGVEAISTGSLGLDLATGIGGLPKGRIIEIYGPESSGKTTVALHCVAEAQKAGGTAAFIDAEHALDPAYAKALGVDIDNLIISQPDNGEQGLEIADTLVGSGVVDIIVIDSVAALVPRAEIEGEMSEQQMGLQARLMSKALRKLTSSINKSKTITIFINQLREKIGQTYGPTETTTGGRALKFYATMRIDVRRAESIKRGEEPLGNRTRVRIVKNKVAPPFKSAEFDITYGKGISKVGEIIDLGANVDIVKKAGAWYSYGEVRLGQGRENAKTFLLENPELMEEIEKKVRQHYMENAELDFGHDAEDAAEASLFDSLLDE